MQLPGQLHVESRLFESNQLVNPACFDRRQNRHIRTTEYIDNRPLEMIPKIRQVISVFS